MRFSRLWWFALLPIVAVGFRTSRLQPATEAPPFGAQTERPECPHSWEPDSFMVSPPSASGPITNIPEYHDCQRFIVAGGTRYDSLYAIYARYRMMDAFPRTDPRTPAAGAPADTTPRVLATIASYGGRYPALGIRPGVSCLYLALSASPRRFRAFMYSNGNRGECAERLPTPTRQPITELEVRATPWSTKQSPPQVARWDWDSSHREQHIGTWCPGHWCDIGRFGFSVDPAPTLPPDAPARIRPVLLYKGYYDRQLLAVPDPAAVGGQLRVKPSDMMGIVVPDPELATRTLSDYRPGLLASIGDKLGAKLGKPVAYYFVDKTYYREKPPLRLVPGGINELRARIRRGPGDVFEGRVIDADKRRTNVAVIRRLHPNSTATGFQIPPTTRWRWRPNDETTWFACVLACCEVEEF